MGVGLPLFAASALAAIIIVAWLFNGYGEKRSRVNIATTLLIALFASWTMLLSFGAFHPMGALGIVSGFVVSIVAWFTPAVYRRFHSE